MSRTIVSWAKFCEWVQGKKAIVEEDGNCFTVVKFDDATTAVFHSDWETRFGEKSIEPPRVEIEDDP
jgi:hypothetical protein